MQITAGQHRPARSTGGGQSLPSNYPRIETRGNPDFGTDGCRITRGVHVSTGRFRPRVAFQGLPGAFSEDAAIKLLGKDIELVARATFVDLFHSVEDSLADYVLA